MLGRCCLRIMFTAACFLPTHVIAQITPDPARGFEIVEIGAEGQFFNQAVPDNQARASAGASAFGSTELGGIHFIPNIIDGSYGNSNSWIAMDSDPTPFVGVEFNGCLAIESIAWGRDNNDNTSPVDVDDACNECMDRWEGTYFIEVTNEKDPNTQAWTLVGSLMYASPAEGGGLMFWRRHEFSLAQNGEPIRARALRIRVVTTGIPLCIDELEVYGGGKTLYVDADAPGLGDGLTWATAFTHPQDALAEACINDTIRVAQGTYMPDGARIGDAITGYMAGSGDHAATFQLVAGVTVEGGYAGIGEPDPDLRNVADHPTVLSGDLNGDDHFANNVDNSFHVVTGTGTDATAVLDGFTITAGNAALLFGGGLFNSGGSPTVSNCTFSGNSATNGGGGMYNANNSSPTVTNCTFAGNTAVSGGGMYNVSTSNPILTNCTFSGNDAIINGGGIFNESGSSPTVRNCILWGDSPDEIFNIGAGSTPTVSFSDVEGGLSAGTIDGGGNINADPMFVDADGPDDIFGTEDDNLHLLEVSPCINAGDTNALPADAADLDSDGDIIEPTPFDLDGIPRAQCAVDIGAYENQSSAIRIQNETQAIFYCTIQEAIDDTEADDEIVVQPGTYYENINFNGNALHLHSTNPNDPEVVAATIIDGTGDSVVKCNSGEVFNTILDGFTITGGTSLTGGGMYNINSSPTVTNCTFSGNSATGDGGGMYNFNNSPTVTNCTFAGNTAVSGGGMYNVGTSNPILTNCILWGDSPNEITNILSVPTVSFSDVEGGLDAATTDGGGNINADPLFVDADGDDDIAGTEDDDLHLHQFLGVSPCIDAGDNSAVPPDVTTDLDGGPRIADGDLDGDPVVDMGVFEIDQQTAQVFNTTQETFHPTIADAIDSASDGDEIVGNTAAFATSPNIDFTDLEITLRSTRGISQAAGGTYTMANDSALEANPLDDINLDGALDVGFGDRVEIRGDSVNVGVTGSMSFAFASVVDITAPAGVVNQGSISFSAASLGVTGGILNDVTGDLTGFGDIESDITNDNQAVYVADTQVLGDYVNNGTTTIQNGTLTILGALTNNGVIVGDFVTAAQAQNNLPRGSGDGFFVQGDFAAGPDAAILMPSDEAVARMGSHWGVAITDNTNYDMIQAELRMVGLGEVAQSLETMSADIGNCPAGLDRSLPGHYPIGTLRIGPSSTIVDLVDAHDNDQSGQGEPEAIYVQSLVIDFGATLNTNLRRVYYESLTLAGDVDDPDNLIAIEPVPGDFSGDCTTDLTDYASFFDCAAGPDQLPDPPAPITPQQCLDTFDFDNDNDVDLHDFGVFADVFGASSQD